MTAYTNNLTITHTFTLLNESTVAVTHLSIKVCTIPIQATAYTGTVNSLTIVCLYSIRLAMNPGGCPSSMFCNSRDVSLNCNI